jgi:Na+-translocating ferredoxin:NAD+ oxidoreductase RnfE subunit
MNDRLRLFRGTVVIFRSDLLFRNPVVVGALGLYPIVAAGFGLKNGVALSLLFLLIAIPSEAVLCVCGGGVPKWARPAAVLLVSAVFYVPAWLLLNRIMPGTANRLGMAASLTVCNSVLASHAEEYAPEHILPAVLADAAGCSIGFGAVLCLVSSVRELWLTGGVWGLGFAADGIGGGFDLPFAGFLLLGLTAAAVQWINLRRAERGAREG